MGTFVIKGFTSVGSKSSPGTGPNWGGGQFGYSRTGSDLSDAAILAGINSPTVSNADGNVALFAGFANGATSVIGTWLIRLRFAFPFSDDVISLDGNPLINFNELPAGFTTTSATLKVSVARYPNVSGDIINGDLFLQLDSIGEESADLGQVDTLPSFTVKSFAYDFTFPILQQMFFILTKGFGIRVVFPGDISYGQQFFDAKIEGTYVITGFSFTLDTPTVSPSGISPANHVQISSGGGSVGGLDFTGIPADIGGGQSGINFTFSGVGGPQTFNIPTANIITQTTTLLQFTVPTTIVAILVAAFPNNPAPNVSIIVTGDGSQFSGTMDLGLLAVLLADASGIYRIVRNKTNDTLYDRTGDTVDVKIPDPFFDTGYVGG